MNQDKQSLLWALLQQGRITPEQANLLGYDKPAGKVMIYIYTTQGRRDVYATTSMPKIAGHHILKTLEVDLANVEVVP